MQKRKSFLYSLLVLATLWSCSKEEYIQPLGEGKTELSLLFPLSRTNGAYDPREDMMSKLRIIIFKSTSEGNESDFVLNKLINVSPEAISVEINEIVPIGYLNIYLIGNEPDGNVLGLDGLTNTSLLSTKLLDYTSSSGDWVSPLFVMYSVYKAVRVNIDGSIAHPKVYLSGGKYTFPIERTVAKYTIHINCDFVNMDNRVITIDSATVISMPLTPNLIPLVYTGANYFSSKRLDASTYIQSKWTGLDITGLETISTGIVFYMPEHYMRISGLSHYTYLRLVGSFPYPDGSIGKLVYHIPLGNGLGDGIYTVDYLLEHYATVDPNVLSITRNTHYTLELDIKGFGQREAVEVVVVVKPWLPTIHIPIDIEP